ncbi:MAG: hypothetical protein Q9172_003190 [Xanthocarpia lactea]
MAPLLRILIQLLPSLSNTPKISTHTTSDGYQHEPSIIHVDQQQQQLMDLPQTSHSKEHRLIQVDQRQQQPIDLPHITHGNVRTTEDADSTISTISWGANRLDVFGLRGNNLTHKYRNGNEWGPAGSEVEILGNGLATPPVAVTWGVDRLDVFGLDDHNVIKHQYWDGTAWKPDVAEFENLGGECDPMYSIAVSTWGPHRLDIFCKGHGGELMHQYYDGSQWQPSAGSLESLGGSLAGSPSVVSWGENRLDIFGVTGSGEVAHLYWDGHQWSKWETFENSYGEFFGTRIALAVTSWGENRLDIYGVASEYLLYHKYWDGSQWSDWEYLGWQRLEGVAATSWSANRLDIVVKADAQYFYKYYDGHAWRPDVTEWYSKSPDFYFSSNPSVVSWGENRLDIFAVYDHNLLHQTWTGDMWFPGSTGWEMIGRGIN